MGLSVSLYSALLQQGIALTMKDIGVSEKRQALKLVKVGKKNSELASPPTAAVMRLCLSFRVVLDPPPPLPFLSCSTLLGRLELFIIRNVSYMSFSR